MLAIRLKRVGRTNDPSFRIIVQDHRRSPKRTRGVVEFVGFYDARKGEPQVNAERIKYWISMGAQPSDTVHNILVSTKVIDAKKVNAMNKKTPVKKEVPKEEPKAVAPKVEEKAEEKAEVKPEEPKAEAAAPVAEVVAEEKKEVAETPPE